MTDSMNALKLMYLSAFYTLSSMGNALEIGISTTYFFLIEMTECWWEEILGVGGRTVWNCPLSSPKYSITNELPTQFHFRLLGDWRDCCISYCSGWWDKSNLSISLAPRLRAQSVMWKVRKVG